MFRFLDLTDSPPDAMDIILNFDPAQDRIDLSALDAFIGSPGDDSFTFLGVASLNDVQENGPGALWLSNSGSTTMLMYNVNRNPSPDLALLIDDGSRVAGSYSEDTFLV